MHVDIERHDWIKRQLRRRKITFAKIAEELGVSCVSVTMVCQGHRSSQRVQQAIADKLGVEPCHLWPGKYAKREGQMKR
ncbi:helix-turn-helix domain-containing protein [Nitratireductor rhodophyticola]|uniref:Helix-turn-helix domain-containing protein n=1 Tax=Nitratireductor indicus C115 TaxID=1231190 RepID=K2NX16_9HYPH|nr:MULTISPECIES: helix-turn-helix domain-containing protein [Nitratireductor]EKF42409.1 helix-turn-helix domain-containing protein [Nitratireductor indicus C115]WPZ14555.1 helix-turn-helix domain-containing protein [Nitratireductor rhodophyticola]WPZ15028.1 helix-turn-helix domain-containing protein [Nitratireductor rhodophyticola]SFQ55701.1 transcriptional regulator, Nlp family [Nitratireductor indicus]